MPKHTVAQGDCFSSLAAQYGIPFTKLWNHPDNAALKQQRKDPNVLYPGDVVTVPEKELREEMRAVDARHPFKKKGEPTHVKIRLLLDDQPRAGVSYELQVAGNPVTGTTDGDGYLTEEVPPDAHTGVLTVTEAGVSEVYQLSLGALDPIDTDNGVRERLESLGYPAEDDIKAAVRGFQAKEKLTVTGDIDDALRAKLKEEFGQ